MARQPVVLRPRISETESNPRMQHAEQHLKQPAMEDPAEEPVSGRNGTEPVPMPETEHLSAYGHTGRLDQLFHAQLLEIAIGPDIVVALEEIHIHSGIHEIHEGGENPRIAFRHHITVLIPEIPDIPEKIQGCSPVSRDGLQKGHEPPFPVCRVLDIKPQMDISNKVCKGTGHRQQGYRHKIPVIRR